MFKILSLRSPQASHAVAMGEALYYSTDGKDDVERRTLDMNPFTLAFNSAGTVIILGRTVNIRLTDSCAPWTCASDIDEIRRMYAAVEGEYLGDVAKRRWPVLIFIFCFDIACFLFRFVAKLTGHTAAPGKL